jgi:electron transfer flavoprotein beta subunit
MKVVVCVKQTPSTTATFKVTGGVVSWEDASSGKPNVVNPWDEYAIEEGIRLKENHGAGDVVALNVGNEDSVEVLRTALAMGCTDAVHVSDAAFAGLDSLGTAKVLAAAIEKIGDVSIVITGKQAIDGDTGMTPVQLARKLGWTPLTNVAAITAVSPTSITVERLVESGRQVVTAALPVVLGTVKEINDPRYPSFMGIRKANKAVIPTWGAGDLGADVSASRVDWSNVYTIPAREGSVEMITGDSAQEIAEALVEKLFEEKVI